MGRPRKLKEVAGTGQLRVKGDRKGLAGGRGGRGRRKLSINETTTSAPRHQALRALCGTCPSARAPELAGPTCPHTLPCTVLVARRSDREQDSQSVLSWSKST